MALVACSPSAQQIKKVLEEHPEVLTAAFEKHPVEIIDSLNKAARDARSKQSENQDKDREKALEEEFKNPKKPEIGDARFFKGPKDAPITIVEYSDFQCPYCKRGADTMKEVKDKFGDKVKILFKHLPLDFHPQAMPAAKYFEAIGMQSPEKAFKFHDMVFEKQDRLGSEKEKFLDEVAKQVGADMKKLKKDIDSPAVMAVINADKAEANKFEFFGTPGYLVNGVSIKGAYPLPEFEKIINRHLGQK